MKQIRSSYVGKTEYKYVYKYMKTDGKFCYGAHLGKLAQYYDNIREAAIAVDKMLILNGKSPIHILKKQ